MDIYCNSLTEYSRYKTRVVSIGDIPLGGDNPIRIQSMTTTDTLDTKATVEQSIRIIESGCDFVRITAPSLKEAQNLENIKKELRAKGYTAPLIADIHFTPNAAELAARLVEKVRVNPGNYADKKKFETIDYTEATYQAELERIRTRFTPLVKICKEYGTAMRIGTNHGSLSDRILSKYGDTPLGMVESAMEFLRICEENNYYQVVLSMKASNPQVMVQAYRLLVKQMMDNGMNYPLHLGVTEAGDGEDGRIKSAVGIGTLLEDGIGDTIRVSLTEDPEFEAPVAIELANRYTKRKGHKLIPEIETMSYSPFSYQRRETIAVADVGANVPRIIADYSTKTEINPASLFAVGYQYSVPLDKWNLSDMACDYIYAGATIVDFELPGTLSVIYNFDVWSKLSEDKKMRSFPLLSFDIFKAAKQFTKPIFVSVSTSQINTAISVLKKDLSTVIFVLETDNLHGMADQRRAFITLQNNGIKNPVIVKRSYSEISESDLQLYASTDFGALLLEGFLDGIWIDAPCSLNSTNRLGFGILQATRTRISKTEYISCPSCGRTLFDLQETTQKIRQRTDHLKGVKIGIMGCIVNGPGEMADADYGYVGTGIGKITLYKGKEVVKKNIDSEKAVDALIELIQQHGDWVEKK